MNVSFYSMFLFGNLVYTFWKADKVFENVQAPSFAYASLKLKG